MQVWLDDINGLEYSHLNCSKPFIGDLPLYVPQVRDNAWNTPYPAYIMNADRIVHKDSRRWLYRRQGVHTHCHIPKESKVIASFCLKDAFLEEIWQRKVDFQDGESFWAGFAKYDFAATMSIEFSCYANQPRMEHVINIKRNVLSAHMFSQQGMPVIMDAMFHTDQELENILHWGRDNNLQWYVLNFQYTKKVPWVLDMIRKKVDKILEIVPSGRALVVGIGDVERIAVLGKSYPGRISVANGVVAINTAYHRRYYPETGHWLFDEAPLASLFRENLSLYCESIKEYMSK